MLDRLHDVLLRQPGRIVAGCALLALAALPVLLATTRLDLSFRPLFADDPAVAAATADFEARFGQPSGAYIGVVIRRESELTPELLAVLGRLSAELAALPHVSDVLGPGRLAAPEWTDTGAHGRWAVDAMALAYSTEAAESAAAVLKREPGEASAFVRDGGRTLLLLVRTALPLDDLRGRSRLVRKVRGAAAAALPRDAEHHVVGVSVVESVYAGAVLRGMTRSLMLTTAVVVALLLLLFGRVRDVVVVLAGVTVAAPVALAVMGVLGRDVTVLGSMVPTIILVIGAADAIHMRRRWYRERVTGAANAAAVRRMFVALVVPCLLTTLTTALGFLSLGAARVAAIRDFGVNVAIGVVLVYIANVLLVPALLRLFDDERGEAGSTGSAAGEPHVARAPLLRRMSLRLAASLGDRLDGAANVVIRRPRVVLAVAAAAIAIMLGGIGKLRIEQRFNEELGPDAPVRVGQAVLEAEFGGFLGPELEVRRVDGGSIVAYDARARLGRLVDRIAELPDVHDVHGYEALLDDAPADEMLLRAGLRGLVTDSLLAHRAREVVDLDREAAALHVRLGDVGTARALELVDEVRAAAASELGAGYEARVVGQWYLAQLGMASLLHDMLASFGVSLLLVLPILGLALRSWRVFLVAILPNLLPALAALAFMGWAGITLRIGTALVLAVALAIGVDDSIHLLARVREARRAGVAPRPALRVALRETGGALVLTTIVLAAGFLSMLTSDLAAIRDMGAVAAVAIVAALLADLTVLPAMHVLVEGTPRRIRSRGAPATSFARSAATVSASRLNGERARAPAGGRVAVATGPADGRS
jgi:uncharacterized protein